MQALNCFSGLIGFTQANECLGDVPNDVVNTSESGLFMDEHPSFSLFAVKQGGAWSNEQVWDNIRLADKSARTELSKLLLFEMRKKVTPIPSRRLSLGEDTGNGYLADFTQPAEFTVRTKNVQGAYYLLTHIGIRATVLQPNLSVTVEILKNNVLVKTQVVALANLSDDRTVLNEPLIINFDGSAYKFRYTFTANIFPAKNSPDCGCTDKRAAAACFIEEFPSNYHASGFRLLGEIVCDEMLWPCLYAKKTAGLIVADLYRSLLVNLLYRRLVSGNVGKINGITMLSQDKVTAIMNELAAEAEGLLNMFSTMWEPPASCCWQIKTRADLGGS